jgi:hypothetical protein
VYHIRQVTALVEILILIFSICYRSFSAELRTFRDEVEGYSTVNPLNNNVVAIYRPSRTASDSSPPVREKGSSKIYLISLVGLTIVSCIPSLVLIYILSIHGSHGYSSLEVIYDKKGDVDLTEGGIRFDLSTESGKYLEYIQWLLPASIAVPFMFSYFLLLESSGKTAASRSSSRTSVAGTTLTNTIQENTRKKRINFLIVHTLYVMLYSGATCYLMFTSPLGFFYSCVTDPTISVLYSIILALNYMNATIIPFLGTLYVMKDEQTNFKESLRVAFLISCIFSLFSIYGSLFDPNNTMIAYFRNQSNFVYNVLFGTIFIKIFNMLSVKLTLYVIEKLKIENKNDEIFFSMPISLATVITARRFQSGATDYQTSVQMIILGGSRDLLFILL